MRLKGADVPAVEACVALGANLGDAQATVRAAIEDVASLPHTQRVLVSSLYRSAPFQAQGPDFINAVMLVRTTLAPLALLHALQALEKLAGRQRPYINAPRTLDLDLILYGNDEISTPELTVPHPRYHQRAFVLHPLAEIAPQRVPSAWLQAVADQPIHRL
jgi:2-amino-4-hydroxy-6-hydroxymethyldihydropteridine diphosphokinase